LPGSAATELDEGAANLDAVLADVASHDQSWNEAETRFHIIDRLIVECLGWPRTELRLETPQGRAFTDYELGVTTEAIWEAKREGKIFEIPMRRSGTLVHRLASVMLVSNECA